MQEQIDPGRQRVESTHPTQTQSYNFPTPEKRVGHMQGSAGAVSVRMAAAAWSKPQHWDICNEHNRSYLQARIKTSCLVIFKAV